MTLLRIADLASDQPQSLAHLTSRANMAIWLFITHHTEALGGITGMQASVLQLVTSCRGVTSIEIARLYKLQPSSITGLVDRLVKKGLVLRVPSDDDRRVAYLRATSEGEALAAQLQAVFDKSIGSLTDGISDGDLAIFRHCLKHIALNARAAEEAGSPGANDLVY
ncbi:MarR family winged helix-turn-helix transcriptional regulator [Dyella flava]|uniref:MarR family transcriptional regulator n=2 Tax=Dyella flava TaxID=1920170 RepID=A0ABS2K136_9GAMM|nr:MarR family transcriptional regulator [Dyella flava]MBM7124938.1 MarR family transcriptional regulator [Dyella flava]GLQ49891.1 hypothetical protein GCM10010872_13400 [Dyella flava]